MKLLTQLVVGILFLHLVVIVRAQNDDLSLDDLLNEIFTQPTNPVNPVPIQPAANPDPTPQPPIIRPPVVRPGGGGNTPNIPNNFQVR